MCVCVGGGKELTVLLIVVSANRCVCVHTGKNLFMLLFACVSHTSVCVFLLLRLS